jgi:predicted CXXCH cytochrome family protein
MTGAPLCQNCHHPHTGQAVSTSKLWNINGGQDQTSYVTYGNGSLTSASGFASWACMSCHDGAFASSTLYKGGNGATVTLTYGDLLEASPDIELQNDHPVSAVLTDNTDYDVPAFVATDDVRLYPTNASGSNVECASCHDVHNGTDAAANKKMLKASNAGSVICLECHNK